MRHIRIFAMSTAAAIALPAGMASAQTNTAPIGTTPTASPTAPNVEPSPLQSQGSAAGAGAASVPSANAADQQQENRIGEIIVTANRVSSNAQKTPIAITVYNSQSLANAGVRNIQALSSIDPSINITTSTGASYIAIRGVASTDVTEIGDPSVPIARDGFFVNRPFALNTSLYDVQRIEVLKGPQGTLFGRNSTGGLVSIITNRPAKTLGGYASVEVGNYATTNAEGGVNVPVGDRLQIRAVGFTQYRHGYRYLTGVEDRGDDNNTVSGRLTIAFQPFDGFNGLVQYQHDDVDDVGDVTKNLPLAVVTPLGDPKRFFNAQPTTNKIIDNRVRWEFSYDRLPLGLTLTYAGGRDTLSWHHALDATGPTQNPLSQFVQSEKPRTWNHEVRIANDQNAKLSVQAGYFHFDEHNVVDSGLQINSGAAAGSRLVQFNYGVFTKSDAVFGQAGYRLIDNVRLTGGVRYTWDKKRRDGQSALRCDLAGIPPFLYGPIGCNGTPPTLVTPSNGNISQSKPTYLGGVEWTPTNRNLIYAKYSTGYKSGGFNSNGSQPSVDYGPESLKAIEVGSKNRFLDDKLQINFDGFYQIYKGYQASQTTAVVASGSGVFNVGDARIYGAEAQVVAILRDIARIDANATYLHAQFKKGQQAIVTRGDTAAQQVNVAGNDLPNAPHFVATGGIERDFVINDDSVITLRVDGKYSSNFYYTVFNDADTRSPKYAIGNASIAYKFNRGRMQLQGFVRNFTDHRVLALAARNYVSGFNTYEFAPPRTFGGRFSFNF